MIDCFVLVLTPQAGGDVGHGRAYVLAGELTDSERRQVRLFLSSGAHWGVIEPVDDYVLHLPRPGVMDPEGNWLLYAAQLLGIHRLSFAASGEYWSPAHRAPAPNVNQLVFHNRRPGEDYVSANWQAFAVPGVLPGDLDAVPLTPAEREVVAQHYQAAGIPPTRTELETIAQTWSEHCCHKTFHASIRYTSECLTETMIPDLLEFIRITIRLANRPWVRSALEDNAGIIQVDDDTDLAIKVETHNHPSAIEPFSGAHTGVGGVVRDILAVSARPVALTDVLCFGPPGMPAPEGCLSPDEIADGVIRGIADYGNKLGLPTLAGDIVYDDGYLHSPLVFCGAIGEMPAASHVQDPYPGDAILLLGGATGRDGLHGVTFASAGLDAGAEYGPVVQLGNPIMERQLIELFDDLRGVYSGVNDCGGGGLSSAVTELVRGSGARVRLEKVLLKYPGLAPWEIWLSEAQERMVITVPRDQVAKVFELCGRHSVPVSEIGEVTDSGRIIVTYDEETVCDLPLDLLFDHRPDELLTARTPDHSPAEAEDRDLHELLMDPNFRSLEDRLSIYDTEVIGRTVSKPYAGHCARDAAVIQLSSGTRIAIGVGFRHDLANPFEAAHFAVIEAFANVVASGARPDYVALVDNFCAGSPRDEEVLGELVAAVRGAMTGAVVVQAPFVSGKDSLNNEFQTSEGRIPVRTTTVIHAVGVVDRVITSELKRLDSALFVVGDQTARFFDWAQELHQAMEAGWVLACHDVSKGGLGVAVARMAIGGGIGAYVDLDLAQLPVAGAYLVEVPPFRVSEFRKAVTASRCVGWTQPEVLELESDSLSVYDLEELTWRWSSS